MTEPVSPPPAPTPPPSSLAPSGLLQRLSTVALVVVVAFLLVVLAQRAGFIGGTPVDAQLTAAVAGSTPTKKPNPKNSKAYLEQDDPTVKVGDIGPNRWKIVDVHEHAQTEAEAARLLKAMDRYGVQRTCLLAATIYTFTLNNKYGFEQYKENNDEVIKIKNKWPDRFCAFVTFDPAMDDGVAVVKDAVARGADGVKLFLGHGAATGKGPFHVMPLDDPRMEPFWAWAEENQVPVLMHVNLIKYWDETISLLEKHPYLRLCLPHFGLHKNTEQRLARLGWIFDRYPNVFTDMSYGYYTFQIEGFEALAKWRTRSRQYLQRYADRILFASDMVLEATKDEAYIDDTLRSYRQFNEAKKLRLFLVPSATMHGMDLDDATLTKMYETAPARFLSLDADGRLPDRTRDPRVAVERRPLPPLDLDSIPDDPQYRPRTDGKAYASATTLARAAATRGAPPDRDDAAPGAANGENDDGHADGDDEEHHECP
jgi:predicted TIM-barrel fold metal-dependent hydrolase